MLKAFVQAYSVTIIDFQFAEHKGGEDGQSTQDKECLMNAVNHFRRAGVETVRNEARGGQ